MRSPISVNQIHRALPQRWFFVLQAHYYKIRHADHDVNRCCDEALAESSVYAAGVCPVWELPKPWALRGVQSGCKARDELESTISR